MDLSPLRSAGGFLKVSEDSSDFEVIKIKEYVNIKKAKNEKILFLSYFIY